MIQLRFFLCLLLLLVGNTSWAFAEEGISISITPNRVVLSDTEAVLLHASLTLPQNTYIYGLGEDRMGLPTELRIEGQKFDDLEAFPIVTLYSPEPLNKVDSPFQSPDDIVDLKIYHDSPNFYLQLPLYSETTEFSLTVSGLLCSANNCLPFTESLPVSLSSTDMRTMPTLTEDVLAGYSPSRLASSAQLSDSLKTETAQPLEMFAFPQTSEEVSLYQGFTPQYFQPGLEVNNLATAIFFGMIAGLLLNLMPCVLPVLSLKFSALMAVSTMTDRRQQARAFKMHCLVFALGIMTWFVILGLMFGLAGMAWGQMFQEPLVVCTLALILFLLGLSLFGVFTLPMLDLKSSSSANPHWQAFTSGLLATLLATPCSGPLLGGVLGWALQQPIESMVATILSVGLGMAMPYCVLAFNPRLVNLLPKPGNWTLRLEQLLGFLLMGSVVYLFSQLPEEWMFPFLVCLMAVAFSAWLWGQIGHLGAKRWVRRLARCAAVATLALAILIAKVSLSENPHWEKFDSESFDALLGQQNVLVQFTADWCPSCKALEHTTLSEKRMQRLRSKYEMRTIRVDLTRENKAGQALLEAMGSSSIPVIVLFPKGEKKVQPLVVRDLITPQQLKEALKQRFS